MRADLYKKLSIFDNLLTCTIKGVDSFKQNVYSYDKQYLANPPEGGDAKLKGPERSASCNFSHLRLCFGIAFYFLP
jgi:hypothetical protein